MKLLIIFFIISFITCLKFTKFLNLKNKVFFGRFYEFSNIKDDLGYQIPLFTNFGELTDDGMRYYDMCSKKINGQKIGTIITGDTSVGKYNKYGLGRIDDNIHISEHKYLAELVHKNEADIILKIINYLDDNEEINLHEQEIISKYSDKITSIIKIEDIIQIEDDYVQGAIRAKQAGYDCVLISLNGDFNNNILNLFLSSDINKRKDEYGGININNRVKILSEIIKKIRINLGYEYPLGLVISLPNKYLGIKEDEIITACKIAEKSGIEFIQIDTGDSYSNYGNGENEVKKPIEFIKKLSENIKKIQIVIFNKGILDKNDMKTLAKLGIKF